MRGARVFGILMALAIPQAGLCAGGADPIAVFKTSMGSFKARLYRSLAPRTVENFIGLARGKKQWLDPFALREVGRPFYDGLPFYRVIRHFLVETGDPLGNGLGGPGYAIAGEPSPALKFDRPGILAMSQVDRDTGGSRVFVTLMPAPDFDGCYTIFGQVIEGLDVVARISEVAASMDDRPERPVVLESVTVSGY